MAVDKLVDSTQLDACCTAEANAIRAKTGSSAQIAYDWANSKGFADAIAAISGGGGGIPHVEAVDYTPSVNTQSLSIPLSFTSAPVVVYIYLDPSDVPSGPSVATVFSVNVGNANARTSTTSWTISSRKTLNIKAGGGEDSWSSTPEGTVSNDLISISVANKSLYFLAGKTYHIIAVEAAV